MSLNSISKPAAAAAALVMLLTPAACAQTAPTEKKEPKEAAKQKEVFEELILPLRDFLYCDMTLDQFLNFPEPPEGELKQPDALIAAGDARGALKLLDKLASDAEMTRNHDYWLVVAKARRAAGDAEGARRAVHRVLSQSGSESRMVLQAWSILRELGERPPAGTADDALGVVAEIALDEGVMIIAGYDDGTSRIYWSTGGGYVGDTKDEKAIAAARELTRVARPLAPQLPYGSAHPLPKPERVRFTLLTPGGLRAAEEALPRAESGTNKFSPLYSAAIGLMHELLRLYNQNQKGQ
ncbi:MAG TPA: hypothetical protein VK422_17580 [Pyrinomonadaceae bacterium]|nr:hypothetical protein [Pyrinomonadaceae bacterium]